MHIETVHDIPSWDGSDGILAVFILADDALTPDGVKFLNHTDDVVQIGTLSHKKGYKIQPHYHQVRMANRPPKEVLVVKKGSMRVDVYGGFTTTQLIKSTVVNAGDVIVLVAGGHGFEMLEDCEILEVRDGPYLGIFDKKRF